MMSATGVLIYNLQFIKTFWKLWEVPGDEDPGQGGSAVHNQPEGLAAHQDQEGVDQTATQESAFVLDQINSGATRGQLEVTEDQTERG